MSSHRNGTSRGSRQRKTVLNAQSAQPSNSLDMGALRTETQRCECKAKRQPRNFERSNMQCARPWDTLRLSKRSSLPQLLQTASKTMRPGNMNTLPQLDHTTRIMCCWFDPHAPLLLQPMSVRDRAAGRRSLMAKAPPQHVFERGLYAARRASTSLGQGSRTRAHGYRAVRGSFSSQKTGSKRERSSALARNAEAWS